ncbi:restriction endonuclease subunit S [Anabaena sp. CCY 0017]|uniref:restriction endonuclease subunit S n=1 Tax=Anabaena sp. CCY 0017 TaxID=3103866 RepID=UPI0039C6602F
MRHKFPLSWPIISFKEVAEVVTGTTPLTSHPEYYGGSIPFIGPAELGKVESITQSPKSLSPDGAKQARLLPAETVLVCCIGATIGKVGFSGTQLATNQQINALVCNKDIVFPRYVFHYCRTLESLIRHQGASTTLPLLPKGRFQEIEIPIPPLEEQKRIAEILDRAEELRAKRREAIAQLNTLTQSIFFEMFGNSVNNFNIATIEEVAAKSQYALSSGPFGSNLTSQHYVDDGVIILRGLNVTGNRLNLESLKFISQEKAKELARSEVKPGDIVVVAVGSSGLAYQIPSSLPRAIMSQNFNKITPDLQKVNATYLTFCINTSIVQNQINQKITDTVRTFLSLTKLKTIKIPLPPLSLQQEFARRIQSVEKLKASHRASLSELDALFASLQHRAFRGEL